MVDVEKLSDAELRSKLLEFGFPLMPITGTTRKTMTKKLKMLLDNQGGSNAGGRRSLGRFSSDDDSDNDVSARKPNKRQTMGAPPMRPPSPPPVSKITRRTMAPKIAPEPQKKEVRSTLTTTTRTTSRVLNKNSDEFDTGSESDEVAERFPKKGDASPGGRFLQRDSSFSPSRIPSSYISASSAADSASERLSQMKSRLSQSQYSPGFDRPLYASSPVGDVNENPPFLSNFTKRLSLLSEGAKPGAELYKNDSIKENDVNGGGFSSARNYLSSYRATARGRPATYDGYSKTLPHQNIFKNNFVPFMVLVVAFLFFIIVAIVYLGIRSNSSLELSAVIPICSAAKPEHRRGVNCLVNDEGTKAINLLRALEPELNKAAVNYQCGGNGKPYVTEEDVLGYVKANFDVPEERIIRRDFNNLLVLTFLNPTWNVHVIQDDQEEGSHGYQITKSMEDVVAQRNTRIPGLMTSHPHIPWTCYFYNTFSTIFSVLSSIFISVLILYGVNYGYKYYKCCQQRERDEVVAMVENIIDTLQSNCTESDDDNFMVINHARDMIIPIQDRKSKERLWKKAVSFINDQESRIRTEVQTVRGEPYEVWRWLGGPNLNASKNKSWQGQAFETQVGSVNSLPCSPTPCLKIRGMVEEGERNMSQICRAVLSKCVQECRILHCAVDLKSKCVYLKCADTSEAAIAYRNLHGWWYAGNLVTVKYLRLERYMQRFPDSPVTGPPFLQ